MSKRSDYNAIQQEQEATDEDLHVTSVGNFVKSTVFGGLDGLGTTFAIIGGAAGGNLSWTVVLVLGFANIFANSFSMGIGEYFSSKAHREFVHGEKRRAMWEFKHYRSNEIKEMVSKFVGRGMSKADAEIVVNKMAQYDNFFVNLMVTEELGFSVSEDEDEFLLTDAFVMFLSFFGFGSIPLLIYFLGSVNIVAPQDFFAISTVIIMLGLFILGAIKSTFSSVNWAYSGFETLAVGSGCAGAAFLVARFIAEVILT